MHRGRYGTHGVVHFAGAHAPDVGVLLALAFFTSIAAAQGPYHLVYPEQRQTEIRGPAQFAPAPLPPTSPPPTVATPQDLRMTERRLSLDEAIRIALANDRVFRVLAGVGAVNSGRTIYDVAIANTVIDDRQARFDPLLTVNNNWDHLELPSAFFDPGDPNQTLIGGVTTNQYRLNAALTKDNPFGGPFRGGGRIRPAKSVAQWPTHPRGRTPGSSRPQSRRGSAPAPRPSAGRTTAPCRFGPARSAPGSPAGQSLATKAACSPGRPTRSSAD